MFSHGQIKAYIAHRSPMLLVDAITSMEPWERVVGIKAVTGTEPCFARVPDGTPQRGYAYPCSLIMESFGQAGGVLVNAKRLHDKAPADVVMLAAGVTSFRFLREVYPGDTMEHRVHLEKDLPDFAVLSGEVLVRGERVAEIDGMIVAYRPASALARGGERA